MAISAGGVIATLELDISKYQQGLKTADGEMQGFVGKLDKVGGTMGKIGDQVFPAYAGVIPNYTDEDLRNYKKWQHDRIRRRRRAIRNWKNKTILKLP